ncbi:MAG: cysteine desulfurase family protein [Planctomycetota bacterium]
MADLPVYLDNHATTRVDPRVVEAMVPYFTQFYGNAGSVSHAFGWRAQEAVDQARQRIAAAVNCTPREIIFTSGATESNNLAIRGVAERVRRRGNHVVTVATEHKAVLDPISRLGRRGYEVTILSVESATSTVPGRLDPANLAAALRDDTLLASVMLANNEIGTLQPLAEIAAICRARGVLLHCDATQAVGKLPVDVRQLGVDLLSFSAHKLHGPKGVGALYVRRGIPLVRLEPQMDGGGQEFGVRSGTLNVPGIIGFARAVELSVQEMTEQTARWRQLRERLYLGMRAALPDMLLNGPALDSPPDRLANNLNCHFPWVDGEALMMGMRDVAVSSGAACTSTNPEPSHVLRAIGLTVDQARASLRFGLGRFTTEWEIDFAIQAVSETVRRLRQLSSLA